MNQSIIKKIGSISTIRDMEEKLNINRATAINYIHLLRRKGLVRTWYKKDRTRLYIIKPVAKPIIGNESFYDIINKYSPMKVAFRSNYRIVGRNISVEEAIIRAIETKHPKLILASLALFNHIKNWSLLSKLSKKYNVRKKVGALYELTKRFMRVRKINKKTLKTLLNAKNESKFIVDNFKSKDFKAIEKKWKVYLPFNKVDILEYEQWR